MRTRKTLVAAMIAAPVIALAACSDYREREEMNASRDNGAYPSDGYSRDGSDRSDWNRYDSRRDTYRSDSYTDRDRMNRDIYRDQRDADRRMDNYRAGDRNYNNYNNTSSDTYDNRYSDNRTYDRRDADRSGYTAGDRINRRDKADDVDAFPTNSQGTIDRFKTRDPSLQRFFDTAYAYVVFPKVAKGAFGVGAANGSGEAFEQGRLVGTAEVTQVTVGLQAGGQTYSEIIFFQDPAHFQTFKDNNLEFAANASAIAVESGKAATNDFNEGVAVFTMPRGGLMFEAAIGGQKLSFKPLNR